MLVTLLTIGSTGCADLAESVRPATFQVPPVDPAPAAASPEDDLEGFAVPIRLDAPRALTTERRGRRVVTWALAGSTDSGVRIMAPTTVRPNGSPPRPAPGDLHEYLRGLRRLGVRMTGDRLEEISGSRGHRFTLRTRHAVRDGLGCWSRRPEDCFSLSPGSTLEVTTFAVRGQPVAIWSRSWGTSTTPALAAALQHLLGTVSFE